MAEAALPWAAQGSDGADVKPVQDTDAATAAAEEDLQPVSIQQLGLEPGARIEVCTLQQAGLVLPRNVDHIDIVPQVMWEVSVDDADPSGRVGPTAAGLCRSARSSY